MSNRDDYDEELCESFRRAELEIEELKEELKLEKAANQELRAEIEELDGTS